MVSYGTIRYSPKPLGVYSQYWMVLDCDPILGKYLRHLYYLDCHKCKKLTRPAWKEHITVIRNEITPTGLWNLSNGQRVCFSYSWLCTNGYAWWCPVECPRLTDIRYQLGLGDPEVPFHLSIGYNVQDSKSLA